MKSLLLSLLFLLGSGSDAFAAKLPKVVKRSFESRYSKASEVAWEFSEEDNFWIAYFDFEGDPCEGFFSVDGTWVETLIEIDEADLSDQMLAGVTGAFPTAEELVSTLRRESPEGLFYLVTVGVREDDELEEYTIVFDEKGNVMKDI